jgi:O-antigen ligase
MRRTEITVQPDHSAWLRRIPVKSPAVGIALWGLFLAILAVGLYVATDQTVRAMVGIGLGLPLLWLIYRHPEFGILLLIFLTCNFVPRDVISVRLLGGGLDVRDLMLMGMLGLGILYGMKSRNLTIPWWPVSGPMLMFIGVGFFSLLYALLYQRVERNWAFSEFRPLMYYLTFFAVAWIIVHHSRLVILLVGLFLLADLTSTIILMQQFLGKQNALLAVMSNNGAWYVRDAEASGGFGSIRIVPPGHALTFVMSIVAFCFMPLRTQPWRRRAFFVFQFIYLNIGLLFTYTRAQWVASVVALTLLIILLPLAEKVRIMRSLLIILLTFSFIYGLFGAQIQQTVSNANFIDALSERALSLFTLDQTLETNSLEWRVLETKEAFKAATQHPIIGVGLGNTYREPFLLQGEDSSPARRSPLGVRFTRFVHNSYLYLAVKMGMIGILSFICFALAFLLSGWRMYTRIVNEQYRHLTLAIIASFVGFLLWAGSQSHLLQVESTVVVGTMIGLIVSAKIVDQEISGGQLH